MLVKLLPLTHCRQAAFFSTPPPPRRASVLVSFIPSLEFQNSGETSQLTELRPHDRGWASARKCHLSNIQSCIIKCFEKTTWPNKATNSEYKACTKQLLYIDSQQIFAGVLSFRIISLGILSQRVMAGIPSYIQTVNSHSHQLCRLYLHQ